MSELEIKTFNLRSCVEDALQTVAEKATAKQLDLTYLIDKASPDVIIGDPKKLGQILTNLLNNSVDSTYKGEVEVSVSSVRIDQLFEIHFEIRDSGIGVSTDRFDRLINSGKMQETNKNNDMGLSICRELVELMSGRIWAESKLGEGSKFHFTIKTRHVSQILPLNGIQLPLDGRNILIMEGNARMSNSLKIQVAEWGMIPTICASAQEALKLSRTIDSLDVALLDVSMLNDKGISLGKQIHEICNNLPLVALTFAGQRIESDFFASLLAKPVRQSDLFKTLKLALASQSASMSIKDQMAEICSQPILRVLLAEDNASNQKVILSMLKRLGHRAQAVSNGREALQALERQPYDLVLMDVRMPEMDGLEATRTICRLWPNKMKIIAITAHALKGDRERCLEAGMDDYISKPVKIGELKEMLKKHMPHWSHLMR